MRACSACIRALCSSAGCVLRCNISAWYIIASGVLCCNATPHRMARRCCLMYQYTPHVSLSSLPQWDPSVVDYNGRQLYDKFVLPRKGERITDYRTSSSASVYVSLPCLHRSFICWVCARAIVDSSRSNL
jgi:hypothetical protein